MNPEFYRVRYEEEWTRQAALQQNAALPIAFLSLLGTSLAYWAQRFDSDRSPTSIAFWLAWVTSFSLAMYSATLLIRFFHGVRYATLDPASRWLTFQRDLEALCVSRSMDERKATERLESVLIGCYAVAASQNQALNERRGKLLFVANRVFLVAAVAAMGSVIPFAVNQSTRSPAVYQVQLVEPGENSHVGPGSQQRAGTQGPPPEPGQSQNPLESIPTPGIREIVMGWVVEESEASEDDDLAG